MSEVKNEGLEVVASITCWNCEARVSLDERSGADGQCPHCTAELELDDYLAEALAGYAVRDARADDWHQRCAEAQVQRDSYQDESDQLRAELAALRDQAGQILGLRAQVSELSLSLSKTETLRAELAAIKAQEPVAQLDKSYAYDAIDLFLRNELCDDTYGKFSAYLDLIYAAPVAKPQVYECPRCGTGMQVDDSAKPSPVAKPVVIPEREVIAKLREIAVRERMFRIEETYTSPEISDSISLLNSEIDGFILSLNAADQEGGV